MRDIVEIDGVLYKRVVTGNRKVVVVDRGWIFAGDVTRTEGGLVLSRTVWVLRWEGIGLDGLLANPKSPKVHLRQLETVVEIPADAEIFSLPVADDWGLP